MRKATLFILLFCLFLSSCVQKNLRLESPDGKIVLLLGTGRDKQINYSVLYADSLVIQESVLGFQLKGGEVLGENVRIGRVETSQKDTLWTPVFGESSSTRDFYNQSLVSLVNEASEEELIVTVRAYNEGVAFRYTIPSEDGVTISKELTQFTFPKGTSFWTSYRAQQQIRKGVLDEISDACDRPVLAELKDSVWLAVGEAALVDFARMKFVPEAEGKHALVASLEGEVFSDRTVTTPWRYVMVAESPAQLLENNYLLLNLNEPNKISDPTWIKPGKVIRDVTLSTRGGMACIDFAASHGLQYIAYDAGWYGDQYDINSDATTVSVDPGRYQGGLDLQKVINYGIERGVGVILYVNQNALENQLDEILPLYRSWGVAGLKFGFVEVGPQKWTSWLHEAVRKCADYQMMVDIHDEYRPTGYSRTYPNLMTQEGIRGDEESPDNALVINTIFTRMIAGAGDQTNCYFAERVGDKMASHCSQMAKSICIYSPWQFLYWYDRPLGSPMKKEEIGGSRQFIQEIPDLDFYSSLPTVWDDRRILDGYPGQRILIARKSGEEWFVGALSGSKNQQYTIKLEFLDPNKSYEAVIYTDDPSLRTRTNVQIRTIAVDRNSVIRQNISAGSGLAAIISPI